MKKDVKSSLISEVKDVLSTANGIFVVENHGLTVRETEELRNRLRPISKMFRVVKNRLMKLALAGGKYTGVSAFLKRPTAVVLADDPYACAKAIYEFAEKYPKLTIVGGQMDVDVLDTAGVVEIAKLPSMDEARATLLRLVSEPMTQIARVADAHAKNKTE